ncbi:MAG: diguanylate cyclase [Candidatus Accumulibacter sp.]|jgi:diguanylate cyclase (GGDEF)-like protein|nr:diguanylate cyclase [Accumulibacter sp.]
MENDPKQTVLIVDDEVSNLLALNKILSSDYAVFFAKSGEEALSMVADNPPDLILLDVVMPNMNGFDMLVKLKHNLDTADIPVVFITGMNDEASEKHGFASGAVDYIIKPFSGTIVKARVDKHMQLARKMRLNEALGRTDTLTGMPNRRAFDEHADREWKRCIRDQLQISFLMIDIDRFNIYNDTYGHAQGDALLKTVAQIFTSAVQRPSDLAARIGGEEFGVLLLDTHLEGALLVAEKIRADVSAAWAPGVYGGALASVTVSIGVASGIPRPGDSFSDFYAQADANLYVAKEQGRNRIFSRH